MTYLFIFSPIVINHKTLPWVRKYAHTRPALESRTNFFKENHDHLMETINRARFDFLRFLYLEVSSILR